MPTFAPGQRWTYHTRPGEETSTVLILAMETGPDDVAVHIRLDGLRLRSPHLAGGLQEELAHSPVSESALQASVIDLIEDDVVLPVDQGGLERWRDAFTRGEAGVFTLPVAALVDAVEQAINTTPDAGGPALFHKSNLK
ncbi:hypothetical protein E7T09_06000 [Deinococcus sp. KSM4-11]|uniref:hypothetical protein n=1 Tax=Deinococcus sp. KSM4-11 TaxID=2568654 RepID=UPI0010A56E60|nr:hypothetical protein [Deinococcus sp. KSM4-11]THF88729.1 hypothetical protein E7T09_06000 [Deinococcus sp. KSM4-11]